jgi:plastocyanin
MKRITITSLILIIMFSFSAISASNIDGLTNELTGKEIPAPLGTLFGDEKINIHFEMENGEELILGLVTENNKFKSLEVGKLEKPSLNVYTTEAVIKEIENSNNPPATLKKALEEKKITYKAVGFVNKIKFAVLSVVMKFLDDTEEKVEMEEDKTVEKETEEPIDETEITKEVEEETIEEVEVIEPVIEEPAGPKTHVVKLIDGGFENTSITIKVGDTVEWHNFRNGNTKKALVLGAQQCIKIKSGIFELGDHYSWTFDKAETCNIVDGIYTTAAMKVIVKE